ncbi:hypothetical protein SAMN05421664_2530 [Chryseobacterium soldanellicola]|uniref:Lipoprotein n=1 Tax=Chryseobacterium soldanellicola TaxID=311333 RepID=A0A1H1DL97_9FLAO|nr:hypothetical protein [Chryseobacterium soldanellicola]SDQ77140.1 hypothetical protein SAMN05421664_2530 [Chryseobacterium soldanellicola]
MKKLIKYVLVLAIFPFFAVMSCKAKIDNANLPKDIAERPADENSQKYDQAQLDKLKAEIDAEISKEKCTDATTNEWKPAPMGSKSCGGPKYYVAYPAKLEAAILPKIESYNAKEAEFNKKYSITSDCSVIGEPVGIRCINGKAEVVYPVE